MALEVHCGAVVQWEVSGSQTVLVIEPDVEFKDVPTQFHDLLDAAQAEGFNVCVTYEGTQSGAPPYTAVNVEHE